MENCKEEIPEDVKICPVCNETLDTSKKTTCPYCKEVIEQDSKVCPVCGETLTKSVNIKIKLGVKAYISIAIILVILLGTLGILTARADDIKSAYTVIQNNSS